LTREIQLSQRILNVLRKTKLFLFQYCQNKN
jgi:hypothetical protein